MNKFNQKKNNFINRIIDKDLASGKCKSIHTRFPPEPNGYLHIGHAKSICLNFGIAQAYKGKCNLRFDDTNPAKEEKKFVDAIKYDVKWLGFKWDNVHYASDYSEKLYNYAIELINKGLAYVDELPLDKMREYRGTLVSPGKDSPYRSRHIKENLFLFSKMRNGDFAEGSICLRAKIDMSSPFMVMRDPVLYRVKFINHYRIGNRWCIHPTYDFTHCISDALEGITHSLCTLEFQDNRRLYDWILNNISIKNRPRQYEFSRLNLEYVVMSKRKLGLLVSLNLVEGWDDPRMPTISGLRRRGYTPKSIREFCCSVGITKQENCIEMGALESCIRRDLNERAPRIMAVLNPIKVIINNLPEGYEENITMLNHPFNLHMGTRQVVFSKEIFIDRNDFFEKTVDDKKIKKLMLGKKVRLRNAYVIQAESIKKNEHGVIDTIYCTYDPQTLNQHPLDKCKVKGIIHWVSAIKNIAAEFYLYDYLFTTNYPFSEDFLSYINPQSLTVCHGFVERNILYAENKKHYQFEREGYFCIDSYHFSKYKFVFNRTVKLRGVHYKNKKTQDANNLHGATDKLMKS
ncbi:glutamine--tRNA ligase [Blochmannia endosymbiont of Colobopsis nipponica]|uniref:glutamine--tRNA ligase n=1 Tax=Blochmannia endosymbiont of Colobopsis nipponica TaxID=2681987 RepID=UPI0017855B44|nr:glutamine--tRNA ligase [Blochmannia endosymbiont of Colobopsis nipponica]QOI11120.1 glutamine--tRNA ligase [Blochmannia endosymbiont of Colobopsis nipponica]